MDRRQILMLLVGGTALTMGGKFTHRNLVRNERSVFDHVNIDIPEIESIAPARKGDYYLPESDHPALLSTFARLGRVENFVGHGNFNVLGFDEMLRFARHYSQIGPFTKMETDFIDQLFNADVGVFGFHGDKVVSSVTATVPERDRVKISATGQYLYRGRSESLYNKLRDDIGETVVLTSGIRSVVKQSHLFLGKIIQSRGNVSRACINLAPPGHSYHGIGDFDVGKQGLGRLNFTESFAKTDEYRRLVELGYAKIRYHEGNQSGIRYEPWHVKVV